MFYPSGFDSLVQESKGKARDALDQAAEIRNLIKHAEDRTQEAQNALAGAESDARVARDSAKQAQEYAEQASKVIISIYISSFKKFDSSIVRRTL